MKKLTLLGKLQFKKSLKEKALELINARIEAASVAMLMAQESANDSDKNSAGDKYETSRAMGQIDSEMNARQLEHANKDLTAIQNLDIGKLYDQVDKGALVITENGNFFISAGLGASEVDNQKIYFISLSSPFGQSVHHLKKGSTFTFNGKSNEVKDLF
jgi:hypothetical protein